MPVREIGTDEQRQEEGRRNSKNGNQYLAWAFIEAANFAIRGYDVAHRYHQKKASKTNTILAGKALPHKLRASYFVMRDKTPFVPQPLFG